MNIRKLVLSALMLALGLILPFITMQIPQLGNMLLPMQIPVLLCGFLCGAPYGAIIGFVLPLLRSILIGMPVLLPSAMAMAIELMVYGLLSGVIYSKLRKKHFGIYFTLIPVMLIGRIAWGITAFILFRILGMNFTWEIFKAQAFFNAIPGIILQFIFIPPMVSALTKTNLYRSNNEMNTIEENKSM